MANYVLLETIQLTQNASSVVFDNIPATGYTDLKIVASARSQRTIEVDGSLIRFNGDTTAGNYSSKRIYGSGTAIASDTTYTGPFTSAEGASAKAFACSEAYIPNYNVAGVPKIYYVESASENNAANAYAASQANLWSGTAAITSITLTPEVGPNFMPGSTFGLYAIAAIGTTPTVAPKATGGNIVANDGTYWYHAFLSSGTFTPQTALTCDYLVVAGGGSGGGGNGNGGNGGGGGGAGGVVYASSNSLNALNYAVTVGAGGAQVAFDAAGTIGSTSSINLTSATGGGGGGSRYALNGQTGGSGGGGAADGSTAGTAGSGTSGQGNAGGSGRVAAPYSAGGGGGAGAAGTSGNGQLGAGGAGTNTYSAWHSATYTGVSGYIAGGGGGGTWNDSAYLTAAPGGSGGGGAGGPRANPGPGVAGTMNTGGGGGGGGAAGTGGQGGSGLVIIRYAMV